MASWGCCILGHSLSPLPQHPRPRADSCGQRSGRGSATPTRRRHDRHVDTRRLCKERVAAAPTISYNHLIPVELLFFHHMLLAAIWLRRYYGAPTARVLRQKPHSANEACRSVERSLTQAVATTTNGSPLHVGTRRTMATAGAAAAKTAPPAEDAEDVTTACHMTWMNGTLCYAVFRGNQGTAPLGTREYLDHSGAARGRRKRNPRERELGLRAHQRRNHALPDPANGQACGQAHAGSGALRRKARGTATAMTNAGTRQVYSRTAAGRVSLRRRRTLGPRPKMTCKPFSARRQSNALGRAQGTTQTDGATGNNLGPT